MLKLQDLNQTKKPNKNKKKKRNNQTNQLYIISAYLPIEEKIIDGKLNKVIKSLEARNANFIIGTDCNSRFIRPQFPLHSPPIPASFAPNSSSIPTKAKHDPILLPTQRVDLGLGYPPGPGKDRRWAARHVPGLDSLYQGTNPMQRLWV